MWTRLGLAEGLVLGIALLAFVLRAYRLDAIGFDWDEGFGVGSAYAGLAAIVQSALTVEPHPPLFYSFIGVWHHLAGNSEVALRLPAVMADVLTVPLIFALARMFAWRWAGVVAGLLITLSSYQVWYSQDVRMYAPAAFLCLAAIYCGLRLLRRPTRWNWIAYDVFMLLALYIHYYSAFMFAFINAFALVTIASSNGRLKFRSWLLAQLAPALLFLPWLVLAFRSGTFSAHLVDANEAFSEALRVYTVGRSLPGDYPALPWIFVAMALLGLAYSVVAGRGYSPVLRLFFAAGYALAPLLLALVVSQFRPVLAARYLMANSPAFYLLVALGIVAITSRLAPLGALLLLLLASVDGVSLWNHYFNPDFIKDPFPAAVQYVERHLRPSDGIILDSRDQAGQFWYYHVLRAGNPVPSYPFPLDEPDAKAKTAARLDELMAQHHGLWVFNWDLAPFDAQHTVENYLAHTYFPAFERTVGSNNFDYYAAPSGAAETVPLGLSCGGNLLLKDVQRFRSSLPAGAILPLAVDWQALRAGLPRYMASWRLMDASGQLAWQRDLEPNAGFSPSDQWSAGMQLTDRIGIPLPADLLPGSYTAKLVMYDKATGQPCQLSPQDPSGLVTLQTIQVPTAPPLAPIDDLAPLTPVTLSVGGLQLLAFEAPSHPVQVGRTLNLKLRWQASQQLSQDYSADVRILDPQGKVVQQQTFLLGDASFTTSKWQPNRPISTNQTLVIPPTLDSGSYRISLLVHAPDASQREFAAFPPLTIQAPARDYTVPAMGHAVNADFAGQATLLGYTLQPESTSLKAGQQFHITLVWRDIAVIPSNLKVFVHLETAQGKVVAQEDSFPNAGQSPTTTWTPNQVITDGHVLDIPKDAATGDCRLVVGLYDAATGVRLSVTGANSDAVQLGQFSVGPAG